MKFHKKLATAVSGAVLLMAGQIALADSTTDIVDALVSKGVLTEEEGKLITKGAQSKAKADEKANKSRISVGSFIDNATMYGDIRARYERRDGQGNATGSTNTEKSEVNRARYKTTLGINTKSGNWYSDWAMSISSKGTSDNVTFGDTPVSAGSGMNNKTSSGLFIKRAQVGWNVTDWLSIEAGRMANPLYSVNAMVFDRDIVFEGAQEKFKYKVGDVELFGTAAQWITGGNYNKTDNVTYNNATTMLALQAGLKTPVMGTASFKGAISYYDYYGTKGGSGFFSPQTQAATNAQRITTTTAGNSLAQNDLNILDIPVELNFKTSANTGMKIYGEYANNMSGEDRAKRACNQVGAATNVCGLGDDHDAWLIGATFSSAKDLAGVESGKGKEGDWSGNIWYQSVGAYALDPSAVDSDIFDGRINMEGTSFKGQYLIQDNVAFNFTGAWGTSKNKSLGAGGSGGDLGINLRDYTLYQFDLTYKF